jgi:hypothetical protein
MRVTTFHSADYVIGLEHDGRQFTITVPFDAFQYVEIMAQAYRERGVTLPYLSQSEWSALLQRFIAGAIADGADIGPISRANRIVTGRDETQKH